jgi:hypothetical protein
LQGIALPCIGSEKMPIRSRKLENLEMTSIINWIIEFDCNEWTSAHAKSNPQISRCPYPITLHNQLFRLRNIEISKYCRLMILSYRSISDFFSILNR